MNERLYVWGMVTEGVCVSVCVWASYAWPGFAARSAFRTFVMCAQLQLIGPV